LASAVADPAWLAARRERAASLVESLPLPSFKGVTGWEFTDIAKLDLDAYAPAAAGDDPGERAMFAELADPLRIGDDVPDGVVLMSLSDAAAAHPELVEKYFGTVVDAEDPFVARNEAAFAGGAFVYVPSGVTLERPILLSAVQAGGLVNWRTLIVLEDGGQAEVWEEAVSGSDDVDGLFNTVVELLVGENARLRYVGGQDLAEKSWVVGHQRAVVQRDGVLDWVALGFGAARGKVFMETQLAGPGAEAKVTGAYASHGRQHLDFDTLQEHAAPNTTSDLAFRGVLAERSNSVWRGMIKVDPGAQKTDAFQESRNLLLSKRAHADAIPGLEILANDVRCTHAAAIAQIDPEQLFYLRSRGVREAAAKRLVIEGFLEALVGRFEEGPVREVLAGALERRLEVVLG
jgi:Fe-S cluster assembly protein SufD